MEERNFSDSELSSVNFTLQPRCCGAHSSKLAHLIFPMIILFGCWVLVDCGQNALELNGNDRSVLVIFVQGRPK